VSGVDPPSVVRVDYDRGALDVGDVASAPLEQVRRWLADAEAAGVPEPTGFSLTTVDPTGRPSSRNVLLRGLDSGLVFYTNRTSAKGRDLAADPRCAALFSWFGLQRQIRVEGLAFPVADAESDAYFATRPRGSQVGAWASPQSEVIPDREELERRVAEIEERFDGVEVPRPAHWGGYRLVPDVVEVWQGRPSRLHDRLRYRRDGDGWVIERLAP